MDQLDNKIIEVDGYRYLVNHAPVEEAFEIGVELMKMIGGSVASMAAAAGMDNNGVAQALTGAVTLMLNRITPKESMSLIKRTLKYVEVQGQIGGDNKKLLLDEAGMRKHFHARLGALMNVTGEVLAFTHADFFEAISNGVATIMKKAHEKAE